MLILLILAMLPLAKPCPPNCQYCLQNNVCEACNRGYVLNPNATCLTQAVLNCRVQLNSTHCSICQPTFTVSSKECVKDSSGCVMRNSAGTCQYCMFGTRLTQNTCTGVLNCETVLPNGRCGKCSPGYSLVGQACVQNRQQCAVKQGGVCIACKDRLTLNGFSCIPDNSLPPFCSLFDYNSGRCLICSIGYELYRRSCQRKDRIPFIASRPVSNALSMQVDTLTNTDTTPLTNSDFISQDYVDIEINIKVGQGRAISADFCWQYAPTRTCAVCLEGYYLLNNKCAKSAPQCVEFDGQGRLCKKCRGELRLSNGNCLDVNCGVQLFSRCSKCQPNYTPNAQGICVNQNCIGIVSGVCSKCSQGYTLSTNKLCTIIPKVSPTLAPAPNNPVPPPPSTTPSIIGCDLIQNGVCVRCSANFYPNDKGGCKRVIVGCISYDPQELNCIQCIPIYKQTPDGGCFYEQPTAVQAISTASNNVALAPPSVTPPPPIAAVEKPKASPPTVDENCQVRNNGSCGICKPRYVINPYTFKCEAVPKECLSYNQSNGYCLSCGAGFNLYSRWCLPKYSSADPNCQINEINNYCRTCKPQFYRSRGQCLPVNTACRTYEPEGGECLSCYSGYLVFDGQCILLSSQPACAQYDFQQSCNRCAQRYYLLQSSCLPVSPLCDNYNPATGACLTCVAGYGLSSRTNACETMQPPPSNCLRADAVGNCLTCSNRFYYNSTSGLCLPVLSLCATYTERTGLCLSCYTGFALLPDNSCVAKAAAAGCLSANPSGLCLGCASKYVLAKGGSCLLRDPNCVGYDVEGNCTSCRSGFYVLRGKCLGEVKKAGKDANCLRSNLNNYCIQCNSGYYIESGNCLLADQLCKTFNPNNGYCLTCYDGYRLNIHKCYLDSPIFNCKRFDGSVCQECQNGYRVGQDGSCEK